MKFLIVLSAVVVAALACAPPPGVTWVTKSVTTTTASAGSGDASMGVIRSTWDMARKNGMLAPKVLFRFIKSHPEYQAMFPAFAGVPQAQLMKNGNFLSQAYTIAAGLNEVIQSLGSQELLAQQLNHLGTTHFSRGAKAHMFDEFAAVFVAVLEEEMGSRFTAEAKEAFATGLKNMNAAIVKSLKTPADVPHPVTGMSKNQIDTVRRVWENVRGDRAAVTSTVFMKLFAANPALLKAFAAFGDVPLAALPSNAEYLKQVDLVADRLDNMISTLDNTLQIMGQFKYMGHSHAARGLDRADFELFGRTFMEVLASKGLSADELAAFRGVLTVGVQKIAENLY